MKRRALFATRVVAAAIALATALPSTAQVPEKVYRIAFLASGTRSASAAMVENLRAGLRERGWIEGRNIALEIRFAEGRFERLPELAAEVVRGGPDVIVAVPSPAAVAVSKATRTIPVVVANVADPVGYGLVASLAQPGGNVTGLSYSFGWDVWGKQLQYLKEAVPAARRVALLANPANPGHAHAIENIRSVASPLGLSVSAYEARETGQFEAAFDAMAKWRADAVLVVSDSLFGSHAAQIAALTSRHRLPSMHGARSNVEAGGLLFYGPDLAGQLRQAAGYVDRILKGAKPGDLPIEQPTRYELVVNLATAKALGLAIPRSVLLQADRVIE